MVVAHASDCAHAVVHMPQNIPKTQIFVSQAFPPPAQRVPQPLLCWHAILAPTTPVNSVIYQAWATCTIGEWLPCELAAEAGPQSLAGSGNDPANITIGDLVCDNVLAVAITVLLCIVKCEVRDRTPFQAVEALFFAQALEDLEDYFEEAQDDSVVGVKSEWYAWLQFPPLLDLISFGLELPELTREGITMIAGFTELCFLVRAFKDEACREIEP